MRVDPVLNPILRSMRAVIRAQVAVHRIRLAQALRAAGPATSSAGATKAAARRVRPGQVHERESGLALVAVMWMVAALAILATGLTTATRSEIRVAQTTRAVAEAAALGDAAIQIAMLDLRSSPAPVSRLYTRTYVFQGRDVVVRLVPAAGFIDINHAPDSLLLALLVHGAQLDETVAEALVRRIVEWRTPDLILDDPDYEAAGVLFRPRHGPFEYPEDLLQVLGVPYDVYDKIRRFITVHGDGSGVDPMAAPVGVLAVLAGGDVALAQQIDAIRASDDPINDLTGLAQEHLGGSFSYIYRIDARVEVGGRPYLRTRWVDFGQPGVDGSAWRTLRVEPVVGAVGQTVLDYGI